MAELRYEKRTCYCGELDEQSAGKEVVLKGWVNRIRDHGGVTFVELRDRSGFVQAVCNPEWNKDAHELAPGARKRVRYRGPWHREAP